MFNVSQLSLILSKKILKANHNKELIDLIDKLVVFNIVKENSESKSQLNPYHLPLPACCL